MDKFDNELLEVDKTTGLLGHKYLITGGKEYLTPEHITFKSISVKTKNYPPNFHVDD